MPSSAQQLGYLAPGAVRASANRKVYACAGVAVLIVAAINIGLLAWARTDAYVDMAVALICAPGANVVLAALSIVAMFGVRRFAGGTKTWPFMLIVVIACAAAIVVDEWCLVTIVHPPPSC